MCRLPRAVLTQVVAMGIVAGWPSAARAQDEPPIDIAPPLRVVHVEGEASLIRDGAPVEPGLNTPLIEGDRFRTASGRAELGLPRGAVIFLDRQSSIDLRAVNRVRLLDGRMRLASPGSSEPPDIVIDAPGVTLTPSSVTSFLLEASVGPRGDEVVLRVEEGVVEFASDRDTMLVRAGESASVHAGGSPTPASGYTRAERSEFDIWVGERLRRYQPQATTASSNSPLPSELGGYEATLNQYGSWGTDAEYGSVWYPSVAEDWRPYSVGYWDRVGAYGSFWVGYDPWAWPTHHYGRWGYRGNRWFWAPGAVWGPAWVSWSIGPGYVGWCPLGYNNLPVFGFGVDYGGWGGSYYYGGGSYYGPYWRGWSVVPSHRFHGYRQPYRNHYVDPRHLSHEVRSSFVTQRVPPAYRRPAGQAVPRYGTPRGSGSGSEAYDRARPYMDSRNTPGAWSRGPSRGSEPYDRARPYMDRSNVPSRAGGGAAGSTGGDGAYQRARPYMNPGTTPGTARPRGAESPGAVQPGQKRSPTQGDGTSPRSGWSQPSRNATGTAMPRSQPRSGGSGWASPAPRSQAPSAEPNRSRTYSVPRGESRGYDRPAPRGETSPRAYSSPRSSAAPRGESGTRSYSPPRSESGRSMWGGGSSTYRSAPRASSPSRGNSGSRAASPRGGSSGGRAASPSSGGGSRSRSPRG